MIKRLFKRISKRGYLYVSKDIIDIYGDEFWLEVYDDHIKLIPINK